MKGGQTKRPADAADIAKFAKKINGGLADMKQHLEAAATVRAKAT